MAMASKWLLFQLVACPVTIVDPGPVSQSLWGCYLSYLLANLWYAMLIAKGKAVLFP